MNLPDFVLACPATLALLIRAKVAGTLPDTFYHAAWDALVEEGEEYAPSEEVETWLRARWGEVTREHLPKALVRLGGRPSKLTDDLLAKIEQAAETGLKDPQIYALLAIPQQTWSHWLGHEPGFSVIIAQARARMSARMLQLVPVMEKGWQAPVWLLTQHFPQEFSRPNADTTVNVSAMASASASATTAVVIPPAKVADLQARKQRQVEKQLEREALTQQVGNN